MENFSQVKKDFLLSPVTNSVGVRQTKIDFLINVASCVRRPSNSSESIAYGYSKSKKGFYDGEPELIVKEIEKHQPDYFNEWPRRSSEKMSLKEKKAAVGEILSHHYKGGAPAHSKPNLKGTRKLMPNYPIL